MASLRYGSLVQFIDIFSLNVHTYTLNARFHTNNVCAAQAVISLEAKAGIGVRTAIAISIVVAILVLLWRRNKRTKRQMSDEHAACALDGGLSEIAGNDVMEADGRDRPTEAEGHIVRVEITLTYEESD